MDNGTVSRPKTGRANRLLSRAGIAVFTGLSIAVVAGTLHGSLPALLLAATACALTLLCAALGWNRPQLACAFAALLLCAQFAGGGLLDALGAGRGTVSFAGRNPADSAALVLAGALIAAGLLGVVFIRSAGARIAIVLATVYAAGATLGAVSHGGLPAALSDGWPARVRGAYAGAEVLLPCAALVTLAFAVLFAARRRPGAAVTALVVTLAFGAAAHIGAYAAGVAGLPTLVAFEHPHAAAPSVVATGMTAAAGTVAVTPQPASTSSTQPSGSGGMLGDALADAGDALSPNADTPRRRVDAMLAKAAVAQRYIHREDFDVAALAATLPADPSALAAFVRDRIALEAYSGAMRGPAGTLMSRAGNSDDKALLLAALLEAKGVHGRFAFAPLAPGDRSALQSAAAVPAVAAPPQELPAAFYTDFGVTKEKLAATTAARAKVDAAYVGAGLTFAQRHLAAFSAATGPVQSAPSNDGAAMPHVFVQAQVNGNWRDLDPSLPGVTAGTHVGGDVVTTSDTFPAERKCTLRVRVIAGFEKAGETAVLDRTFAVADLAGTPIDVTIAPAQAGIENIAKATSFVPSASAGSDTVSGAPFALSDERGGRLTALRFELSAGGGGIPSRTYTRTLWAGGGAADAPFAIAHDYEILTVPGAFGDSFGSEMQLETLRKVKPLLIFAETPKAQRTPLSADAAQPRYPLELLNYVRRDAQVSDALSASTGVRFTFDRPDIVMLSSGYAQRDGHIIGTTAFDIVDNARGVYAGDPAAARSANLKRGIIDTYLEQHALRYLDRTGLGAPQVFAAAKSAGIGTAVVDSPAAIPPGLPAPSASAIRETLAAGQVAIAVTRPVDVAGAPRVAWWAIDPRTGDAVGRMGNGAGAEMAEESVLLLRIRQVGMAFTLLGCAIYGPSCAEDFEIGVLAGAGGTIGEAIAMLKSIYDAAGGEYPQPPDSSVSGGQSKSSADGEGGYSGTSSEPNASSYPPYTGPYAPDPL